MSYTNKTSILIPEQLPEFIRGDVSYSTFVTFMKAYYEWMELSNTSNSISTTANSYNQGTVYGSKNLPNYFGEIKPIRMVLTLILFLSIIFHSFELFMVTNQYPIIPLSLQL